MQAYRIRRGAQLSGLERVEHEAAGPGPHEVRVRMRAAGLNFRDLMLTNRGTGKGPQFVPGSDGAGEVIEIGGAVTRVQPGNRVLAIFYPNWIEGDPTEQTTAQGLGGGGVGTLAEEVLLPEHALVHVPSHLTFEEAATIPTAGVTAWNALFGEGPLTPSSSVLLLGTGGISMWALQLATAAGLRTIITSSDDRKLERARDLGAHHTINYRNTPDWVPAVHAATHGRGVDLVVETGGRETLARSLEATRMGGRVAIVGVTSGMGIEIDTFALIDGAKRLTGVLVGSRAHAEALVRFVELHQLRPVIDRTFGFDEVREGLAYLQSGRHVGKVVVSLTP